MIDCAGKGERVKAEVIVDKLLDIFAELRNQTIDSEGNYQEANRLMKQLPEEVRTAILKTQVPVVG